ncbi:hypothetical protein [Oceanobacillus sp. FSL W7-1293]|uniref:hypothetical protein n=1 Tax=Oceanobacillus sp. FSL W7-1293 TaxID=2921699 RepID=UPI0030D0BFDA
MDFEMEEVSTKEAFQKEKKKLLLSSIRFFCVFLFASLLMMVIRSNYANIIDYMGPPVIGGFIYYFVQYAGLRRSYRRNK